MFARMSPLRVVLYELRAAQDSTDGGIADPVTQADQLAVHSIPPAGILPCQSQNQSTDLVGDSRSTGPVRIAPFPCNQASVPCQQGRRRDQPVGADRGWQHPGQGGQDRSVRPREPVRCRNPV
jgi:hypothetical protein